MIDVRDPSQPKVVDKIRTGLPVGDEVVGGSSPGAVVAGKKKSLRLQRHARQHHRYRRPHGKRGEECLDLALAAAVKGLRGVLPFGMALSPDEKRLYVACAGINAVAVVETDQMQLLGFIPTAGSRARVALSADDKTLFVANAKGFGAGPNGGQDFQPGPEGPYIGDITKGTVSITDIPKDYAVEAFHAPGDEEQRLCSGFPGAKEQDPGRRRPPDFPDSAPRLAQFKDSPRGLHHQREPHL